MESDSIKELLSEHIIKVLQQNHYTSQSQVVQEYLNTLATVSMVADDNASNALYDIVTNEPQQYTWDDYWLGNFWEEIKDKDLGIVRKINLK